MHVCSTCGYATHNYQAMWRHLRANTECASANFELGHLVIRGRPEDADRIEELKKMIALADKAPPRRNVPYKPDGDKYP